MRYEITHPASKGNKIISSEPMLRWLWTEAANRDQFGKATEVRIIP